MNKRKVTFHSPFGLGSSIQAKLVSTLLVLTVGPLLLLGLLITHRTEQLLTERISEELRVEVATAAETLDVSLDEGRRDLLFLAGILQKRLRPQMDEASWRRMEKRLLQELRAGKGSYQLRFVDAVGREVLGIDKRNGALFPTPPTDLGLSGEEDFFQGAMVLRPGGIYLSGFVLAREGSRSSPAQRLVSHMATSVVDSGGSFQGVLVTHIYAQGLLQALGPLKPIPGIGIFLIDHTDRYLAMGPPNDHSNFHVDNRQQLEEALGLVPPSPASVKEAVIQDAEDLLVALAPVHPMADQQWLLAKSYPKAAILGDISRLRLTVWALALPLTAMVMGLAFLTARRFTRPVRELSIFAEAVAGGDYERPVTVSGRDELGQLALSLREMGRSLADSRARLVNWNRSLQEEVARKMEALHESEEKYRLIFSAESDAIVIFNAATRKIVDANPAAERLYGYAKKEFLRLSLSDITSELAENDRCFREVLVGKGQILRRVLHRRRDGSVFPAEVSAGTFTWDGRQKLVCIVRDITERQKVEELKDEMLSAVSHEMRTPLAAMLGFAEYLLDNEVAPEERREYLGIILKESERLKDLVENLLSLQRLRAGFGKESFTAVPPETLFQEVVRTFSQPKTESRLRVVCPEGLAPVHANQVELTRALENLVSNALKYSPADTPVLLGARPEKNGITFWVRDQGPGIPEEQQKQIFNRYFRIDFGDSRRVGGTGLGLPLVKEVAQAHDGRVWVERCEGKGSLFCLFIPFAEASQDQARSPVQA